MKNLFFDDFRQFWLCFRHGAEMFFNGLCKMIYAIIFGIASLFRWFWGLLVKAVGRYPKVAIVIAIAACIAIWLTMVLKYKPRIVTAEHQRDTLAYRLKKYETMYDGNTDSLIIVRKDKNDTLTYNH